MVNLKSTINSTIRHYSMLIRCLAVLLFIITIILATSCKIGEKLFPTITDAETEEVKNICAGIKLPSSFVKVKEINTIKSNLVSYSTQYTSADSSEEVEKYFIEELTNAGWKVQSERGGGTIRLFSKKNKYAILIELEYYPIFNPIFNPTDKLHSVSCSIGVW